MPQLLIMDLPEEHAGLVKDMLVELMKTVEVCNQEKGKTEDNLAELFLVKSIHLMADTARMVDLDRDEIAGILYEHEHNKLTELKNTAGLEHTYFPWHRHKVLSDDEGGYHLDLADIILAHLKGD